MRVGHGVGIGVKHYRVNFRISRYQDVRMSSLEESDTGLACSADHRGILGKVGEHAWASMYVDGCRSCRSFDHFDVVGNGEYFLDEEARRAADRCG